MKKRRLLAFGVVVAVAVGVVAYDQVALWWGSRAPEDEAARLAGLAQVSAGDVVAEIGAGAGAMARDMAPRVLPGGRLIVTELADSQLETLREMVATAGWKHVEVRRGEIMSTALEPECCDLIYMRHVFHHFADPAGMSRGLHQSLARDGRLAIIEFPPNWLLGLIAPVVREGSGGHGTTPDALQAFLTGAGFTVEHVDPGWTVGSYLIVARK